MALRGERVKLPGAGCICRQRPEAQAPQMKYGMGTNYSSCTPKWCGLDSRSRTHSCPETGRWNRRSVAAAPRLQRGWEVESSFGCCGRAVVRLAGRWNHRLVAAAGRWNRRSVTAAARSQGAEEDEAPAAASSRRREPETDGYASVHDTCSHKRGGVSPLSRRHRGRGLAPAH